MIKALDVFKTFNQHRNGAIVTTSGTVGAHWRDVSSQPGRDIALGGSLGQVPAAALGLALGRPNEKMVVFDSEGALLMNLGVIATIAGKAPKNYYHFVLDNECYATTGGQPVPNATNIDYAGMAKAAGYKSTYSFTDLEDLVTSMPKIMQDEGPVFIAIKIEPEVQNLPIGLRERRPSRSRAETIRDLQAELGITVPA